MGIFYVYELWNPLKNQPFYVGKGYKRNRSYERYFRHIRNAKLKNTHKTHKENTIIKILKHSLEIGLKIMLETSIEHEAFEKEKQLIKLYGRKDNGTGILTNRTDGGDGLREIAGRGGSCNKGKRFWYKKDVMGEIKSIDSPGDGYLQGRNPLNFVSKIHNYSYDTSDSKWYHNPLNPIECKMIKHSNVPDGWILGRGNAHITDKNRTKGYKRWYNPSTNESTNSKNCPEIDWILGVSPTEKIRLANHIKINKSNVKGSKWYYNSVNSLETKMIKDNQEIPNGWMRGRGLVKNSP